HYQRLRLAGRHPPGPGPARGSPQDARHRAEDALTAAAAHQPLPAAHPGRTPPARVSAGTRHGSAGAGGVPVSGPGCGMAVAAVTWSGLPSSPTRTRRSSAQPRAARMTRPTFHGIRRLAGTPAGRAGARAIRHGRLRYLADGVPRSDAPPLPRKKKAPATGAGAKGWPVRKPPRPGLAANRQAVMSTSLVSRRNSVPITRVMTATMIGYHRP